MTRQVNQMAPTTAPPATATIADLRPIYESARLGDLDAQAALLREIRARHGLTQAALGELLGTADTRGDGRTVRRLEAGHRRPGGAAWRLIEGLLAPDEAMLRQVEEARAAHPDRRGGRRRGGSGQP